jgi:uncharacterized protein YebE (UPF0316 family)
MPVSTNGAKVSADLLTMMGLATLSVALWTVRVAVTAGGHRLAAAAVASIEAVVFVAAFSKVVDRLDSPSALVAYGAGVGLGTLLGLVGHARLIPGHSQVEVVAPASSTSDLVADLQRRGWPLTVMTGDGLSGPVVLAFITVDDRRVTALLEDIGCLAPDALWTVRAVHAAHHPGGMQSRNRSHNVRRQVTTRW